jgi:membrane protein DedA with SNARE-associated domain
MVHTYKHHILISTCPTNLNFPHLIILVAARSVRYKSLHCIILFRYIPPLRPNATYSSGYVLVKHPHFCFCGTKFHSHEKNNS